MIFRAQSQLLATITPRNNGIAVLPTLNTSNFKMLKLVFHEYLVQRLATLILVSCNILEKAIPFAAKTNFLEFESFYFFYKLLQSDSSSGKLIL